MRNYVNKFIIAINSETNEVVLDLLQESPVLDINEGGLQQKAAELECVAQVVMSGETMNKLIQLVEELKNIEASKN